MKPKYLSCIIAIDQRINAFQAARVSDDELRKMTEDNAPTLWRRFVAYFFDDLYPERLINYYAAQRILKRQYGYINRL